MNQHAKSLWMKELLERLECCHDQWEHAGAASQRYFARAIERDLGEFRRVCQSMRLDALSTATA